MVELPLVVDPHISLEYSAFIGASSSCLQVRRSCAPVGFDTRKCVAGRCDDFAIAYAPALGYIPEQNRDCGLSDWAGSLFRLLGAVDGCTY
ncbi:MAG: hypothetical protein ACXAEX_16160, partial [Promethearchaeota archaeon]